MPQTLAAQDVPRNSHKRRKEQTSFPVALAPFVFR
jgi:hypothetical protein